MKRVHQHRTAQSSLLVFVGALIVFVTFVVKEGLSDRFKDSVAILDQAQEIFALRDEVAHLRLAIFNVVGTYPTEEAALSEIVRLANIGNDFIEENLETISHILVRVEAGDGLWRRFDTLKQERLREQLEYRELQDELLGRNGKQAKTPLEIKVKLEALTRTGNRLREEERTLKADVIHTAKAKRDRDEGYYHVAKWAGYFLYTIGWGLGLVGKVYEVRADGTD